MDKVDATLARVAQSAIPWDEDAQQLFDKQLENEPYMVRISAAKRWRDLIEHETRKAGEERVTATRVRHQQAAISGGRAA